MFSRGETGLQPQHFQGDVGQADHWQLQGLQPAPELHGSLAWHGSRRVVRCYKAVPGENGNG